MTDLKAFLENIYRQHHCPASLGMDPLCIVRRFKQPEDREIAGFVAALLSYGRVEQINISLNRLFGMTGEAVRDFTLETSFYEKRKRLSGFKHRFNDGLDMALLLEAVKKLLIKKGTLRKAFAIGHKQGAIRESLHGFTQRLKTAGTGRGSFDYLLPSPLSGSACKRLNMYLRWMVRPDDGIDLGLWPEISPADLIVPLDTHLEAVGRKLGLTSRKNADWRAAEEVTAGFRRCCPEDPVRYDFSLCHAGKEAFRMGV